MSSNIHKHDPFETPTHHMYGPVHLVRIPDAAEEVGRPTRIITELVDECTIRSYLVDGEPLVDLLELQQSVYVGRAMQGDPGRGSEKLTASPPRGMSPLKQQIPRRESPADLLKVNDVAWYADVHPRTVRRWVEKGDLKAVKLGGALRIRRSDLDKFLRPVVGAK